MEVVASFSFIPFIFCIAVTPAETYKSVFVPAMYVATLVQCLFFLVELFVGTVHSAFRGVFDLVIEAHGNHFAIS